MITRRKFLSMSAGVVAGAAVAPIALSVSVPEVTATSIVMSNGPTIGDAMSYGFRRTATDMLAWQKEMNRIYSAMMDQRDLSTTWPLVKRYAEALSQ